MSNGEGRIETWDVFLGASLRQPGCLSRNLDVIDAIRSAGLTVFAPQQQLPLGASVTPDQIVARNRVGVRGSAIFLLIAEGAGAGVYYELGLADALGKAIVAFGAAPLADVGAVPVGRWSFIPESHRTESLPGLRTLLLSLRQREEFDAQT
jgi:hypothetical protein